MPRSLATFAFFSVFFAFAFSLVLASCGARSDLGLDLSLETTGDNPGEPSDGQATNYGSASGEAGPEDAGLDGDFTDATEAAVDDATDDLVSVDAPDEDAPLDEGIPDATLDAPSDRDAPPDPNLLAAPRPIAPLSTATVTSQRPTLRWELASGTDGAHVDICRDPACAVPVTSFVASGSSGAPAAALASGVYFWRLRGAASGIIGTPASPIWELFVGARSAPANTSWGTTLDVNADGFPDILVGAQVTDNDVGAAYLYMGGAAGPSQTPVSLSSPVGMDGLFGSSVASAGDVNGDGFADVVVGARGIQSSSTLGASSGAAFVYLGSASGLGATPTRLTGPTAAYAEFGGSVASAGDVNGDGYADVLVGAFGSNGAFLYLGGAAGISSTATPLVDPSGGGLFGISVASAGDVNGDGFADVLVGANMQGTGSVYLYLGGAGGASTSPIRISSPLSSTGGSLVNFGYSVASAGDVDGDGLADVVVGSATFLNGGAAFVYLGTPGGLAGTPTSLASSGVQNLFFGESVASAGDVDGDGYADVIVGGGTNQIEGNVVLFLGGPRGVSASPAGFKYVGGSLGTAVAGAGDVNGDGLADFLVGAPYWSSTSMGAVTLFFGGSSGFSTTPPVTIASPTGTSDNFGISLASAARRGASWQKSTPSISCDLTG